MTERVPFGRYQLLNLLGEGGMATVYRAVMSGPMGFEKVCAVKRIHPEHTSEARLVRAMINEARLGGQLRHDNIVETYEFNEVDGHYYMAMEYVEGWTLDFVLRRCRNFREYLPATVVHEILLGTCRGLDYAHRLTDSEGKPTNLIHRDLKPANIIARLDGKVKIMDFGIARADTNKYKTTAKDSTDAEGSCERVDGASGCAGRVPARLREVPRLPPPRVSRPGSDPGRGAPPARPW